MHTLMLRLIRFAECQKIYVYLLPGFLICLLIAMAASYVASAVHVPAMLCALTLGMTLHYLSQEVRTAPGMHICATAVLRLGIGLLGAQITAAQVTALGWTSALTVVAAVVSTFLVGSRVAKSFGLSRNLGILVGGATAICGASAAMAIASVLPKDKSLERETLAVVALATIFSTLCMLVYPPLAQSLRLPPEAAGLLIGGAIHDVAQVVVAGYALGPDAGNAASVVKLFRVAMLAGVVAIVASLFKQSRPSSADNQAQRAAPLLRRFLILFLALALIQSTIGLPLQVQYGLNQMSQACLMVGVAALGMKTSFAMLAQSGWRQILLMLVTTVWIGMFILAAIYLKALINR
jgi:uncharacterized integral membrane protein (TIGR00698 family)